MAGGICSRLHTCVQCGVEFLPKRSDRTTCCSRECGLSLLRARGALTRAATVARRAEARAQRATFACRICGAVTVRPVCSDECIRTDARVKHRQRHEVASCKPSRRCRECQTVFTPGYGDKRRKFCSPECLRRSVRRTRKAKERARTHNATRESVNPMKVFERDGWRCQLCRVATPKRLRGTYDERAPELDHIVPLAVGGEHSYRNTQCACRRCNAEKGSKPLGQMRLVG